MTVHGRPAPAHVHRMTDTASAGDPASANRASQKPAGRRLKLICDGLASHWYTDLEELDSVSKIKEEIKKTFAVSDCRITYVDEDGDESALWLDAHLLHFKFVAQDHDPMVVHVHPNVGSDTSATMRGECGNKSGDAPIKTDKFMLWSKDDEKRLLGFCMGTPRIDWESVSRDLGRTVEGCKTKWRRMPTEWVGEEAGEVAGTNGKELSMTEDHGVTSSSEGTDGGSKHAYRPRNMGTPWCEDDEKKLVRICRTEPWVGWGRVTSELRRSKGACRRKWYHLRATWAGEEADQEAAEAWIDGAKGVGAPEPNAARDWQAAWKTHSRDRDQRVKKRQRRGDGLQLAQPRAEAELQEESCMAVLDAASVRAEAEHSRRGGLFSDDQEDGDAAMVVLEATVASGTNGPAGEEEAVGGGEDGVAPGLDLPAEMVMDEVAGGASEAPLDLPEGGMLVAQTQRKPNADGKETAGLQTPAGPGSWPAHEQAHGSAAALVPGAGGGDAAGGVESGAVVRGGAAKRCMRKRAGRGRVPDE